MTTASTDEWLSERSGPARGGTNSFDRLAELASAIGVILLIVTGFVASWTTLRDLAVEVGRFSVWLAPVVPLSFDVGIVVLSLKVLIAARAGGTAPLLRLLVLLLSVATVVANGSSSNEVVGRLLHAVPSAMFVVCFEAVVTAARRQALNADVIDRKSGQFRLARWVLAPRVTWAVWRAFVLGTSKVGAARPGSTQDKVAPHATPSETSFADGARVANNFDPTQDRPMGRLEAALEILRDDMGVTAAALADRLRTAGHPVSVRTAQRVRADARSQLIDLDRSQAL